eukprot:3750425-Amphidinium_carterae.1
MKQVPKQTHIHLLLVCFACEQHKGHLPNATPLEWVHHTLEAFLIEVAVIILHQGQASNLKSTQRRDRTRLRVTNTVTKSLVKGLLSLSRELFVIR